MMTRSTLALLLLLSACSSTPQRKQDPQQPKRLLATDDAAWPAPVASITEPTGDAEASQDYAVRMQAALSEVEVKLTAARKHYKARQLDLALKCLRYAEDRLRWLDEGPRDESVRRAKVARLIKLISKDRDDMENGR